MKRTPLTLTTALVALVVLGFVGLTAYGQTDTSTTRSSATDAERSADGAASQQGAMMDGSTMDGAMMARCQMMSQTEISPSDPAAILGQRERLKLSDEQVAELERIVRTARDQTTRVLNEAQTDELSRLPDKPESMMQMHQHMMERMNERGSFKWHQENSDRFCPMHRMMRKGEERENWDARHQMMHKDCCQ